MRSSVLQIFTRLYFVDFFDHISLQLPNREKIMTTPRKEIKREARREQKAEKAALLDKVVPRIFMLKVVILRLMNSFLFLLEIFSLTE